MDPGIEFWHQHLDVVAEFRPEGVERADVVAMTVSEGDPLDRAARCRRGADVIVGGARHPGVDEREPVLLTHEIGVDEPEPGELGEVVGDGRSYAWMAPFNRMIRLTILGYNLRSLGYQVREKETPS